MFLKKLHKCFDKIKAPGKGQGGFTAIELLVVVVVLIALLGVIGPKVFKLVFKGNEAGALGQLDAYLKSIMMYYGDNKAHPKAWSDLVNGDYLVTTPGAGWTLSCTNGGDLKITFAAKDLASTLDTEFDKKCGGGATIPAGTTNVECIVTSNAYCP